MSKNQPVDNNTQIGVVNGADEGYCTATALADLLRPLIGTGAASNGFASGAGAPTDAPASGDPLLYIDTDTTPDSLYWWDGDSWELIGDGSGAGAFDLCNLTEATQAQIDAMDQTDFVAICIDNVQLKVPISALAQLLGGTSPAALGSLFDNAGTVRRWSGGPTLIASASTTGVLYPFTETVVVPAGVTHIVAHSDYEDIAGGGGGDREYGPWLFPVTPGETLTATFEQSGGVSIGYRRSVTLTNGTWTYATGTSSGGTNGPSQTGGVDEFGLIDTTGAASFSGIGGLSYSPDVPIRLTVISENSSGDDTSSRTITGWWATLVT